VKRNGWNLRWKAMQIFAALDQSSGRETRKLPSWLRNPASYHEEPEAGDLVCDRSPSWKIPMTFGSPVVADKVEQRHHHDAITLAQSQARKPQIRLLLTPWTMLGN